MDAIEVRMRRLERTNRVLVVVLALAVGGVVAMGAYAPKVLTADRVRASNYEIVDAKGKVVGEMKSLGDGGVVLLMKGSTDKIQVNLGVTDHEAYLMLADPKQESKVELSAGPTSETPKVLSREALTKKPTGHGAASITLTDSEKESRVELQADIKEDRPLRWSSRGKWAYPAAEK